MPLFSEKYRQKFAIQPVECTDFERWWIYFSEIASKEGIYEKKPSGIELSERM